MRLDHPWADTALTAPEAFALDGVEVLPGFPAAATASTKSTLDTPWSGHPFAAPKPPAVSSLDELIGGHPE